MRARDLMIVAATLALAGVARTDAQAPAFTPAAGTPPPGGQVAVAAPVLPSWKVDEKFHAPLSDEDFSEDPTGDNHRDPFRSFLVPTGVPAAGTGVVRPAHPIVAKKYLRLELKLIAVLQRGTKFFGQFQDNLGHDYIVEPGMYFTKDDLRVQKISREAGVTLELGIVGADGKQLTQTIPLHALGEPNSVEVVPGSRGRKVITDRPEEVQGR